MHIAFFTELYWEGFLGAAVIFSLIGMFLLRRKVNILRENEKERIALIEQLNQSQKMESIGRLAGGVAHDFNNMLAGISGAAEFLGMKLGKENPLYHYTDVIMKACKKASNLTSQLLVFSRNKGTSCEDMNLHECVMDSIYLLRHGLDKRISIKKDLKASEFYICGSHDLIQTAILNLAFNAKDAMPKGGSIIIRTRNIKLNEKQIAESSHKVNPGKYVELTVKDTGTGIPPEIKSKIFDPFFTTKDVGSGNGLGLPTVYGTVTEHDGTIRIKTSSRGTSFHLYFPVVEVKVKKKSRRQEIKTLDAKILIVDDERILLELLKDILKYLGARVIATSSPNEAADLYRANKDIDAVVLDVIMPSKTGVEVYKELKKINNDVKVLFASGYSQDTLIEGLIKTEPNVEFVSKPYTVAEVSNKLFRFLAKK